MRRVFGGFLVVAFLAGAGGKEKTQDIKGWGTATDPDGDCQIRSENINSAAFKVPGKLHDLEIEANTMNAPVILREVSGDFVAELKVASVPKPSGNCTRPGGFPYQGTGFLLWQDKDHYVRFERAAILKDGQLQPYANFAQRADGRMTGGGAKLPDSPTWLRLERRDGELIGSVSVDGSHWSDLPPLKLDFAPDVKVGVLAVNSATVPFTAELSGFRVFVAQ